MWNLPGTLVTLVKTKHFLEIKYDNNSNDREQDNINNVHGNVDAISDKISMSFDRSSFYSML